MERSKAQSKLLTCRLLAYCARQASLLCWLQVMQGAEPREGYADQSSEWLVGFGSLLLHLTAAGVVVEGGGVGAQVCGGARCETGGGATVEKVPVEVGSSACRFVGSRGNVRNVGSGPIRIAAGRQFWKERDKTGATSTASRQRLRITAGALGKAGERVVL